MIRVNIGKCTGCKRCQVACAFFHTKQVSNHLSRIKVLNLYETGIDGPVVCQQCSERYCINDCPSEALSIGTQGEILVDMNACSVCFSCEDACPIGAIQLFKDVVFVCDLCSGDPECIKACTEKALSLEQREKQVSLSEYKNESVIFNPSQKRFEFVRKQGIELRKMWRENCA
jgi:Fe-S-cluster-containing hydrogenase component 2